MSAEPTITVRGLRGAVVVVATTAWVAVVLVDAWAADVEDGAGAVVVLVEVELVVVDDLETTEDFGLVELHAAKAAANTKAAAPAASRRVRHSAVRMPREYGPMKLQGRIGAAWTE